MFQMIFLLVILGFAALFIWRGISYGKRFHWVYSTARTVTVILSAVLGVIGSALLSRLIANLAIGGLRKAGAFGSFESLLEEIPTLGEAAVALVAMILAPLMFFALFFILRGILSPFNTLISHAIVFAKKKKPVVKEATAKADEGEATPVQEAEPEQAESLCEDTGIETATVASISENIDGEEVEEAIEEAAEEAIAEETAETAEEFVVSAEEASTAEETEETAEELPAQEITEEAVEGSEEETLEEAVQTVTEENSEQVAADAPEEAPAVPRKKEKKKDALRIGSGKNPWGMVVGGVCGLLLFLAVMSPVIGMMTVADDAVSTLAVVTDNKPIDIAASVTDGIANNTGSKAVKILGGDLIYSGLTTHPVGAHKVTLPRETAFLRHAGSALDAYRNQAVSREAAAESMRETATAFQRTSLLPELAPDFLAAANLQWSQGRTFHGIKKISLGKNLEGINQPLLDLLATSDYDTIKGDISTGLEVLAKTIERGGLRDGLNGKALLKEEAISEGMLYELLINTHTAPLVGDLLSYSFDQVGHTIDAHFEGDPVADPTVTYASMDDIKTDSSVVKDPEQEAKLLAKVVRETLILADEMEQGFTAAACVRDMGPILDLFAQSETVGKESTAIFLTCILQAERVYDEIGFTLHEATELAATINQSIGTVNKNETVNTYALMLGSVSNAVQVVQASTKGEKYHDTMEALMADLTPTSAKVLSKMMTTNVMTKHGVTGESAAPTSTLINSIFTNLAEERQAGMPDDEYQRESNAVMNLTDYAMNSGKPGKGAFGEGSATGVSADEFVGNILDSKVVAGSMKEQVFPENATDPTIDPLKKNSKLSEQDASELSEAMTKHWAQEPNKGDAETIKTYQAIGAMMGMEVEFTSGAIVLS